jgi:hypothetical protein
MIGVLVLMSAWPRALAQDDLHACTAAHQELTGPKNTTPLVKVVREATERQDVVKLCRYALQLAASGIRSELAGLPQRIAVGDGEVTPRVQRSCS